MKKAFVSIERDNMDLHRENAPMDYHTEARNNIRFAHKTNVLIEDTPTRTYHDGKTGDYSRTGVYFESNLAAKPGDSILIAFENSPFNPCRRLYHAEIKWRKKIVYSSSDFTHGVGAAFNKPAEMRPKRSGRPASAGVKWMGKSSNRWKNGGSGPGEPAARSIHYTFNGQLYKGRVKKVGERGVSIRRKGGLAIGAPVTLIIPREDRTKIYQVKSRVVRSEPNGFAVDFIEKNRGSTNPGEEGWRGERSV